MSEMIELVVERRAQADRTPTLRNGNAVLQITPAIEEDYWVYRVRVSDTQAVVGFPKFGTIGIGFAREEDWNTNLPYGVPAREIWDHIKHNKGDESIPDEVVVEAIQAIREAITADALAHATGCQS